MNFLLNLLFKKNDPSPMLVETEFIDRDLVDLDSMKPDDLLALHGEIEMFKDFSSGKLDMDEFTKKNCEQLVHNIFPRIKGSLKEAEIKKLKWKLH